MPETEGVNLGGNISLVGFEKLDSAEMTTIKKIVGNYIKKMSEAADYKEMRLNLQMHPHGKSFKHEVTGLAVFGQGKFSTSVMEWNVFTAVSEACEKLLHEVGHLVKKEQYHNKKNSNKNVKA